MHTSPGATRLMTLLLVLASTLSAGCGGDPISSPGVLEQTPQAPAGTPAERMRVTGRLLLPGEGGRRGVELHLWVAEADGTERRLWVLPDDDGRFDRAVTGTPVRAHVVAGTVVHRVDAADLGGVDVDGVLDLGAIDLRERLVPHLVRVRATDGGQGGAPGGPTGDAVRAGLWIGPPVRGPRGELPSLGSAQFPTFALGDEIGWLLPPDASAVYFLVERARNADHDAEWPSGERRLFGPYASADFPLELVLE